MEIPSPIQQPRTKERGLSFHLLSSNLLHPLSTILKSSRLQEQMRLLEVLLFVMTRSITPEILCNHHEDRSICLPASSRWHMCDRSDHLQWSQLPQHHGSLAWDSTCPSRDFIQVGPKCHLHLVIQMTLSLLIQ